MTKARAPCGAVHLNGVSLQSVPLNSEHFELNFAPASSLIQMEEWLLVMVSHMFVSVSMTTHTPTPTGLFCKNNTRCWTRYLPPYPQSCESNLLRMAANLIISDARFLSMKDPSLEEDVSSCHPLKLSPSIGQEHNK